MKICLRKEKGEAETLAGFLLEVLGNFSQESAENIFRQIPFHY